MKLIKVRVNKTIEYEVSVPVQDDHRYEHIADYLQSIDWRHDYKMKPLAEYYDWLDWETDNED